LADKAHGVQGCIFRSPNKLKFHRPFRVMHKPLIVSSYDCLTKNLKGFQGAMS